MVPSTGRNDVKIFVVVVTVRAILKTAIQNFMKKMLNGSQQIGTCTKTTGTKNSKMAPSREVNDVIRQF